MAKNDGVVTPIPKSAFNFVTNCAIPMPGGPLQFPNPSIPFDTPAPSGTAIDPNGNQIGGCPGGCGPAGTKTSFPEEKTECEHGFIAIYRRTRTISLKNGLLATSAGTWHLDRFVGCCDCIFPSSSSSSSAHMPGCCPEEEVKQLYLWVAWAANFPNGCIDTPQPYTTSVVYIEAGLGCTFETNTQEGATYFGAFGCATVKVTTTCDGDGFNATFEVNTGSGFDDPQSLDHLDDACLFDLQCPNQNGGTDWAWYVTDRDPATGIQTPDGTITPTALAFQIDLTKLGVTTTYDCVLTFCAAATIMPFVTPAACCYCWNGTFTDCEGHGTVISLIYGDLGSGVQWNVLAYETGDGLAVQILYQGVPFMASGTGAATWPICGPDNAPPWSIS